MLAAANARLREVPARTGGAWKSLRREVAAAADAAPLSGQPGSGVYVAGNPQVGAGVATVVWQSVCPRVQTKHQETEI